MHRNRWRFILPAAALLVGALAAGLALFTGTPVPQRPAGETHAASILITDRTGRTLYEAIDPNGSKQVPVPLAEIPLACRKATIATEDSRFYAAPRRRSARHRPRRSGRTGAQARRSPAPAR